LYGAALILLPPLLNANDRKRLIAALKADALAHGYSSVSTAISRATADLTLRLIPITPSAARQRSNQAIRLCCANARGKRFGIVVAESLDHMMEVITSLTATGPGRFNHPHAATARCTRSGSPIDVVHASLVVANAVTGGRRG
jgi:hypothetical protein